ncbi:hypothetical protein ITJ44_08615 [Clavibacter sp. VKM Ac-2873]|uniref:hypothetical protein n=1 Tax=Clavibacter sp. VKM Ac-2873 TaxID=2783813 RepID=UPI00188D95CE|nr:hypothetical protein [Clavibacter sp. VKM Ac-2873]MBF4618132.1 hypothetical protein [Clavibacter sp. VKM Ac-2873]
MGPRRSGPERIPAVAIVLSIPGLVLSQTGPFRASAAILWIVSGALIATALVSAVILSRRDPDGSS